MKIAYLCGNMAHYDFGLVKLKTFTQTIFTDLGVEVEFIDLGAIYPPFFEGESHPSVDNIVAKLGAADGIVFACTAQLFAPSALLQSFLEYLQLPEYGGVLAGKHCFLMVVSQSGGERSTLEYLSGVIEGFGGFTHGRVGLQASHLLPSDALEAGDSLVKGFVDRQVEDFYRAVSQKRSYISPLDYSLGSAGVDMSNGKTFSGISPADASALLNGTAHGGLSAQAAAQLPDMEQTPANMPSASVMQNTQAALDAFTAQQEQDIEEISRLFSQKYSVADNAPAVPPALSQQIGQGKPPGIGWPPTPTQKAVPPFIATELSRESEASFPTSNARTKSAQQMTQSLPHYFQPQLSAGLKAIVQINISGAENFEGYLYIHSTECTYQEGTAPAPDIIIMADTAVWTDILKGKQTAQKAFMIGGLKVRGDFVLLTKFDNLFKIS